MDTELVHFDELMLGDLLFDRSVLPNEIPDRIIEVTSLEAVGDDIIVNKGAITSSRGNKITRICH